MRREEKDGEKERRKERRGVGGKRKMNRCILRLFMKLLFPECFICLDAPVYRSFPVGLACRSVGAARLLVGDGPRDTPRDGRAIGAAHGALSTCTIAHGARAAQVDSAIYRPGARRRRPVGRILSVRRSLSVSRGDAPGAGGRGWTLGLKGAGELRLSGGRGGALVSFCARNRGSSFARPASGGVWRGDIFVVNCLLISNL